MKKQIKSKIVNAEASDSVTHNNNSLKTTQFSVVGIGASAGGLEALEQFFENMPVNSGMAFVVIQHLDPNHKGMLPELLQRMTKMQVSTVTDNLKIEPNCVYVIPPNKSMSILNGTLHLFEFIEAHGLRLPIDFFFRSLADDAREKSIGIILSGMGSDGSLGLKAIKENAGIAMVQEPASAKFDSMPYSAIKAVKVDIVAAANELPSKLLSIGKVNLTKNNTSELEKDCGSYEKIMILLRSQTGNDFSQYKKNTVNRRIERRMSVHRISEITTYVRYLQENIDEIEILFKELLIGVTSFFRDDKVWEHLKDKVLPTMFAELQYGHVLRAWIPGCSTGEEAYTLAMIFKEAIEKENNNKNLTLQIFATDLDDGAIEQARKAIYPANIISVISPTRLSRFFIKSDKSYRVSAEIREMVVFAQQNVIKNPPFTKLDILSCRNMLIYMNSNLQNKLLSLYQYCLNDRGILILGSAETNGGNKEYFTTINPKLRIYQSTGSPQPEKLYDFPSAFSQTKTPLTDNRTMENKPYNIQLLTDNLLLQQFSPVSVLTTNTGDILYLTGNTGKYLTPAAGKASMNIFTMAREGLRDRLPIAFRKVMQNYEKLDLENIKIGTNGETQIINVTLQKIENPVALKGKIMVIFTDAPSAKKQIIKPKKGTSTDHVFQEELEQERKSLHEELQITREEMQTSQEELKSTNEELQSSNEEMQSSNEELTTSKEEMQSLNEELHTVNGELQSKVDVSARISNDMNNLLNSIEIAILFLDKELNIRQYTAHATKIFHLIDSDIGRHYTDLANDLNYSEMLHDTKEVLRTLVPLEKTITTHEGLYYNIRIMPYRTFDDKIDGLVITFIDITKAKNIEISVHETQQMLRSFIHKVPSVIIGLTSDGKIIEFNPEAEKVFERNRNEVLDQNYFDMFIPKSLRKKVKLEMQQVLTGHKPYKFENLVKSASNKQLKIEWTAHKLFDEQGSLTGIITIGENITML